MKLYLDTETYSETPISYGTYRYVQDCELMLVTYAGEEGSVTLLDLTPPQEGTELPDSFLLREHLIAADEIWSHNALFDRLVIDKLFPGLVPLTKWRCTMARALAHSLPAGLAELGAVLNIPEDQAKHKEGKRVMKLFCTPRPKNQKLRRATKETHPEDWRTFCEYAIGDALALRAVERKLPSRNYKGFELDLWHLDQRINDRGFAVDLDLAEAAIVAMTVEQERLGDEVEAHTEGAVMRATQRDAMIDFIADTYGVIIKELTKSSVERLLDSDIPQGVRELLLLRSEANMNSPAKFRKVIQGVTKGRLRGTLQFAGAMRTARWAGRLFQPQNLARPTMSAADIDQGIIDLKSHIAHLIWENVSKLCSNAVRGVIIAPKARKLVVADLANIEGRGLAWLTKEEWALEAYREYDDGLAPDSYITSYSAAFNVPGEEVTKSQRQIGKVMELFLGYEGGVGAFLTGSITYGFDVEDLAITARDSIPGDVWHEAEGFWDWTLKQKRPTFGLTSGAFIVCDSLKRMWRRKRPKTVAWWAQLKGSWIKAMKNPGMTIECGSVSFVRSGGWMRIKLPSGRSLCYPNPSVGTDGRLSYMGKSQYTRQWCRLYTYGGKLAENITQAVARDVLAEGMFLAEECGYETVLTVHDELITEVPDKDTYNVEGLSDCMATPPLWAPDLPLAAAGFEAYRYRKD